MCSSFSLSVVRSLVRFISFVSFYPSRSFIQICLFRSIQNDRRVSNVLYWFRCFFRFVFIHIARSLVSVSVRRWIWSVKFLYHFHQLAFNTYAVNEISKLNFTHYSTFISFLMLSLCIFRRNKPPFSVASFFPVFHSFILMLNSIKCQLEKKRREMEKSN